MANIGEIEQRLVKAEREIKEIIELMIEVRMNSVENKRATTELLEKYLVEMSKYLKERSKATGESLSSGINIWKIL